MTEHITTCPGPECASLWDLLPILFTLGAVLTAVGLLLIAIGEYRRITDE